MANPTNPNGANQYILDPRQKKCWEDYANPNSPTFGNALQSAKNAGYEDTTAKDITSAPWFLEKSGRLNLLNKAEDALREALSADIRIKREEVNSEVWRIKMDAAKFVAETQGKHVGYSKRTEVTGEDGKSPIVFQISEAIAKKNGLSETQNDPHTSTESNSG